jgi:hypothetical protein
MTYMVCLTLDMEKCSSETPIDFQRDNYRCKNLKS